MYLSWIIPVHNEEKRIEQTLQEVDTYLRSKNFSEGYEILVVNNASGDKTSAIIEKLQKNIHAIKLYDLEGKGKGAAVKHGMLVAQGNIRIFSDADNSTSPSYFDAVEGYFKKGYDVVISSRDSKDALGAGRDVKEPWYREILGNMGNLVIQTFGVWGIWDTQNGFKALTAPAAKQIFDRTMMQGFSFDIEMLALARKFKLKIAIIPIQWKFAPDSKVKLQDYIKVFADVFKIRWNLIANKYKL